MIVLGIETSCDETSVAVVRDGRNVLSNVVSSSLKFHAKYGGIIPEIASRMQLEVITQVADSALNESRVPLSKIDLISVTNEPGLLGSLLVGVSFAKSLSASLRVTLIGINHVHSHLYANFLNGQGPKIPFVALVVSGGHTSLFFVRDFDRIELLGQTHDDACGEAFDKVAKILGLGYPGGPYIEKMALLGDPGKIKFQCSGTKNPLDFSFSGIKTAVLYRVQGRRLTLEEKRNIAAAFQETVINALIKKSLSTCKKKHSRCLVIGGGVAANSRLREKFCIEGTAVGIKCFFPPKPLCLDNAAMVAGLGYQLFRKRRGQHDYR